MVDTLTDQLLLKNCKLYTSQDSNSLTDIVISGHSISRIGKSPVEVECETCLDAGGRLTVPGFIDIHVQGAGGADVLDGTENALKTMASSLAKLGTTGFLATTVIQPQTHNRHLEKAAALVGKQSDGAALLGIHIEGPFINEEKRGGISPDSISSPSGNVLDNILRITGNTLKIMTIAPELSGSPEIIRRLVDNGIIASFGHSAATYEETIQGFEFGVSHVTHIFNAMPSLHHRTPGPVPAIFETPDISVQIISDGVHLHPAIVRMIYHHIGENRCICITDGVQAAGLPEGRYIYNGREYESKNGTARYLDGTLIGSTLSLGSIALKFMEITECSFETAVKTVTANPARLLGIDSIKGSLDVGKDADIVLLDDDYSVWATLVRGNVCYRK